MKRNETPCVWHPRGSKIVQIFGIEITAGNLSVCNSPWKCLISLGTESFRESYETPSLWNSRGCEIVWIFGIPKMGVIFGKEWNSLFENSGNFWNRITAGKFQSGYSLPKWLSFLRRDSLRESYETPSLWNFRGFEIVLNFGIPKIRVKIWMKLPLSAWNFGIPKLGVSFFWKLVKLPPF